MKSFKELGITKTQQGFVGDKISIDRILNREVIVHDFKIEDSKVKIGEKCLHLQISVGETKHVVFTGSTVLANDIQKIDREDFPFKTTIVKENKRLDFT